MLSDFERLKSDKKDLQRITHEMKSIGNPLRVFHLEDFEINLVLLGRFLEQVKEMEARHLTYQKDETLHSIFDKVKRRRQFLRGTIWTAQQDYSKWRPKITHLWSVTFETLRKELLMKLYEKRLSKVSSISSFYKVSFTPEGILHESPDEVNSILIDNVRKFHPVWNNKSNRILERLKIDFNKSLERLNKLRETIKQVEQSELIPECHELDEIGLYIGIYRSRWQSRIGLQESYCVTYFPNVLVTLIESYL